MGALNRAAIVAYMKERWIEPDSIMQAVVANAPLLAMLETSDRQLGGRYMSLPYMRVGTQGRSANYTKADQNAASSQMVRFDVEYVSNYHIAKIEGNTVDDTSGNENAIAEAIDTEMEGAIANMRKDLQHGMFGHVGGYRGRISSITTGNAGANTRIVLTNVTDSKFFEEGMVLQSSANDGSSSSHVVLDSGNTVTITGIDRMQGFLEFASDVTVSISGLAATNYLFADGDFRAKWTGMRGWIPDTDPSAGDSHHGVDRTADVLRLSGIRLDISGKPVEEGIVESLGYANLYDAMIDTYVVNPVRWANISNSIGADQGNRRMMMTGRAGRAMVSFQALAFTGEQGVVPCVSDGGCGINEGLGLTRSSWIIGYSGDRLVHTIDDDGLTIRRGSGDTWKIEVKHRGNLGCRAPGRNIRNTLASL